MSDEIILPEGCIGLRENLTEEELAGKHIDGATGFVFETIMGYEAYREAEILKYEEANPPTPVAPEDEAQFEEDHVDDGLDEEGGNH